MYLLSLLLLSFFHSILSQSCGGTIDISQTPFSSVSSPGYPNYYTGQQQCIWNIINTFFFSVKAVCYIDIPSANCTRDKVTFNSIGLFGQLLGTPYCGTNSTITVSSLLNVLEIILSGTVKGRFTCNLSRKGFIGSNTCDCGVMNAGRMPRIVNGTATSFGQFPSLVRLNVAKKNFNCAGTIIGDNVVMTAAQCVSGANPSDVLVLAGAFNLNNPSVGRNYTVQSIRVHENFNALLENDIALVFVSQLFVYSYSVSPACLATSKSLSNIGQRAISVGWGSTTTYNGPNSPIPRSVVTPIINGSICAGNFVPYNIDAHVCVSTSDYKGACGGDLGGPGFIYSQTLKRLVQIGIISLIPLKCVGSAEAYVNVNYYLNWIVKNSQGAALCGFS